MESQLRDPRPPPPGTLNTNNTIRLHLSQQPEADQTVAIMVPKGPCGRIGYLGEVGPLGTMTETKKLILIHPEGFRYTRATQQPMPVSRSKLPETLTCAEGRLRTHMEGKPSHTPSKLINSHGSSTHQLAMSPWRDQLIPDTFTGAFPTLFTSLILLSALGSLGT